MPSDRIYLLADMHVKPLDAPNPAARAMAVQDNERLARFLAHIDGKASGLVLVGDTFNFWFERRSHVVGDYYTTLALFKAAADSGLDIHHVSGNRDFAVGEGLGFDPTTRYPGFLRYKSGFTVSRLADFGIEPHGPRYRFHQAGKTVTCVHGDALCTRDRMFMLLRWTLQGPLGRTVMRLAPWSMLDSVFSKQQGRVGIRNGGKRPVDLLDETAIWREMAMGADILVCGHIHSHFEKDMEVAGRTCHLAVLPAWLDGGYGVVEDGQLRVEWFDDKGLPDSGDAVQ